MPITGGAFTGGVAPAVVALTDASTITLNASLGNVFAVVLAGNRTLANPTSPVGDGQKILIIVKQDATGGRTLSFGSQFEFSALLPAPVLSTAPGKSDYLGFAWSATATQWRLLAYLPGF